MLINKSNTAAVEIRELTGSYYANNDFLRIKTDWILAEEEIKALVGADLFDRADDHYNSEDYLATGSDSANPEDQLKDQLVQHLQIPIAFIATFRYYQTNIVSHEDSGRKVKIDTENEKLPWEWMLDRDDTAQVRKAQETTDRLIRFLEEKQITEWIQSDKRALTRRLFVNTETIFQDAYPMIDSSPRFFYTTTPFNREVQTIQIKKALGTWYATLFDYWESFQTVEGSGSSTSGSSGGIPSEADTDAFLEELLLQVQTVIPLLVMIKSVTRLSLQVLPYGVVQHFKSMMQTANASQATLPQVQAMYLKTLREEAADMLDDIKRLIHENDPDATDYQLLPSNKETNKFFRT